MVSSRPMRSALCWVGFVATSTAGFSAWSRFGERQGTCQPLHKQQQQHQQKCSSHLRTSPSTILRRVVSFNDFDGDILGDATSHEGQKLAQEFYEQVRQRQLEELERRRQLERLERALKSTTALQQQQQQRSKPPNSNASGAARRHQDAIDYEKEFRKWTGQQVDPPPPTSAGFFHRARNSVVSYPSAAAAAAAEAQRGMPRSYVEDQTLAERALWSVMPYVLAAALVISLAMGTSALEGDPGELELIFQDSASGSSTTTTTLVSSATADSMAAGSNNVIPNWNAELLESVRNPKSLVLAEPILL